MTKSWGAISLKKILSLVLVLAILCTSLIVSSVGAATTNPMQKVLVEGLQLNLSAKLTFVGALETAMSNEEADIIAARNTIYGLFPAGTFADDSDVEAAVREFAAIEDSKAQEDLITNIIAFNFESKNFKGKGFDTIVSKLNRMLTGEADNGGTQDGVSLIIEGIVSLNIIQENGVYVQDGTSNSNYIDFVCNPTSPSFTKAMNSFSSLVQYMDFISEKIAPFGTSSTPAFEKLLLYAESVINVQEIPAAERTALKTYLNDIDPDYYKETVTGGGTTTTPPADSGTTVSNGKATVPVTPTISGDIATVTPDKINPDTVLAAAGTAKEIDIVIDTKNAKKVNAGLPADLLTKAKAKGVEKIEIKTSDVSLGFAPDFAAEAKDAKSVSFTIDKVTVTDEIKAKMSDEQKALLTGNDTILDFKAAVVAADGTEKQLSNFSKPITIKVKYTLKAGENKDNITVLYLADDGTIKNMVGKYDEATGEIIFATKHFSTYIVKSVVKTFTDIKDGAYYKAAAEALAAKGVVEGKTTTTFVPDVNVTRAEFVKMLVLASGAYDENATSSFNDVKKGAWYYSYVASAVNAGIAGGIGNNNFGPNNLITRQEMATMIANAMGVKSVDDAASYLNAPDADKVSSFAKTGMALSVKNGFILGINGKLEPLGKATRAMAATVIYRYFNFK